MTSIKKSQEQKNVLDPENPRDLCELTDTLLVLPIKEEAAIIESLYFTLEHSTSEDFDVGVRKLMLRALNRLVPKDT